METHTPLPSLACASAEVSSTDTLQPPDEDLMAAIQNGDASALETLVQRYRRLLKSAIMRTVNDDAAAEDVMQECLLDLWKHAGHYSATKGKPLAWLMTLGRRRAIDHLRRSAAYSRACDRMEVEIKQTTVTGEMSSGADCEQADIGRVLGQHISLLPDAQQEVIRLAFLQGMTQREVAHATHTPLGTVKTRLELGLRKLRQTFRTRNAIHTLEAA